MSRDRQTRPPDTGLGTDRPDPRKGNTQMQQGETQGAVPRTPSERDDSADSQAKDEPSMDRMAQAAQRDVERGLQDTSKGAELDDTYERVKAGATKKFRP